jgi:hypothetical protein
VLLTPTESSKGQNLVSAINFRRLTKPTLLCSLSCINELTAALTVTSTQSTHAYTEECLKTNSSIIIRVNEPITVAARSKAYIFFSRSNSGIVDSSPTQGMDVSLLLFCLYVVLCVGSGLATCWSPVHGVLPTVNRIKELKKSPKSKKKTVGP